MLAPWSEQQMEIKTNIQKSAVLTKRKWPIYKQTAHSQNLKCFPFVWAKKKEKQQKTELPNVIFDFT